MSKVYIIGAGASADIGLPTGTKIKEVIKDILTTNSFTIKQEGKLIPRVFLSHKYLLEYGEEIKYLKRNLDLAYSIDTLVENSNDQKITDLAKFAIFAAILQEESKSKIFVDNIYNPVDFASKNIKDSWYIKFFQIVSKRKKITNNLESLKDLFSNITFIVFNYDRCLEFMLFNIFRRYFVLNYNNAIKLVESLNIIHPYGSLGKITDIGYGGNYSNIDFDFNIYQATKKIKTYSEATSKESLELISNAISNSTHRIFLGFSYERQNMEILKARGMYQSTHCYGTSYSMSEINTEHTENLIREIMPGTKHHDNNDEVTIVKLKNIACSEFFTEFEKVIE
jgi:hypothetical protein